MQIILEEDTHKELKNIVTREINRLRNVYNDIRNDDKTVESLQGVKRPKFDFYVNPWHKNEKLSLIRDIIKGWASLDSNEHEYLFLRFFNKLKTLEIKPILSCQPDNYFCGFEIKKDNALKLNISEKMFLKFSDTNEYIKEFDTKFTERIDHILGAEKWEMGKDYPVGTLVLGNFGNAYIKEKAGPTSMEAVLSEKRSPQIAVYIPQESTTGGKRRNTRRRNRKSKKTRKSRKNRRKSNRRSKR